MEIVVTMAISNYGFKKTSFSQDWKAAREGIRIGEARGDHDHVPAALVCHTPKVF